MQKPACFQPSQSTFGALSTHLSGAAFAGNKKTNAKVLRFFSLHLSHSLTLSLDNII